MQVGLLKAHLKEAEDGLAIILEEAKLLGNAGSSLCSHVTADMIAFHDCSMPQLELLKVTGWRRLSNEDCGNSDLSISRSMFTVLVES